MASPTDRRYKDTHEWHKLEGDVVVIGLTKFAVEELTDVTYVDIKKQSGSIKAGESFGEIESVKTTSELYSGIDGIVIAVNAALATDPALVNHDPYARGWMIKVRPTKGEQLDALLSAADYDKLHS